MKYVIILGLITLSIIVFTGILISVTDYYEDTNQDDNEKEKELKE